MRAFIFSIIQLIPLAIVDLIPSQTLVILLHSPSAKEDHNQEIILSQSVNINFIQSHIPVRTHLIAFHHTVTIPFIASQKSVNTSFVFVMNCESIDVIIVKAPENINFIHSHTHEVIVCIVCIAPSQSPVMMFRKRVIIPPIREKAT